MFKTYLEYEHKIYINIKINVINSKRNLVGKDNTSIDIVN